MCIILPKYLYFEYIMKQKPTTYKDFPNHEDFYNSIRKLIRKSSFLKAFVKKRV